jgi:hypothetical protein
VRITEMFGGKTVKNIYCLGSYKKLKEKPFSTTTSVKLFPFNKAKQRNSRYIFLKKVCRKISHYGKILLKIINSIILPLTIPADFSFTRRNFRQVEHTVSSADY